MKLTRIARIRAQRCPECGCIVDSYRGKKRCYRCRRLI